MCNIYEGKKLNEILKRAFDILETSDDNREKLQAMELFKNTHLVKLELLFSPSGLNPNPVY